MKHFKVFDEHADYQSYIDSSVKILPNLSFCKNIEDSHLNPKYKVITKYNIESAPVTLKIRGGANTLVPNIYEISVDGVVLNDIPETYTFDTTGEHVVKTTYNNSREIPYGAYSLNLEKEVIIPEGITTIGEGAFNYNVSLNKITIPVSLREMKEYSFAESINIDSLYIRNLTSYCNITGEAFTAEFQDGMICAKHIYLNNVEITNLVIPNNVKSL